MTRSGQLPLPLDNLPRYGREDFLVGKPNEAAFAHIERWPRWLAPAAILVGPEGSGKTHLATIFATRSGAVTLRGDHLTGANVPELAREKAVVLEDCDRYPPDETALFHLLNLAREEGFFVMITARIAPGQWQVRTPDLLSRLRSQPLLELRDPDDGLVLALLLKHFSDRQLAVDPSVVTFLVARVERSCAAIQALVSELDRRSLVDKRPVTRALAVEVLGDTYQEEVDG